MSKYVKVTINNDDGSIQYDIMQASPWRFMCAVFEFEPDRSQAKKDADLIVKALNALDTVV